MTIIELVGLISVPITILATSTIVFVSVAFTTKKNRNETIKIMKSYDFGINKTLILTKLWAFYFHYFFGEKILSKRQIITIPIYTLIISIVFFIVWISSLYLFNNPSGSFSAPLPIQIKQAIHDFYSTGIIAALIIDIITIQLTKLCIRARSASSYRTLRFVLMFMLTIIVAYFIFSLSVYFFRLYDMVRLYMDLAPNDPIPTLNYTPIKNITSSLNLFQPETIIHVTSQGWYTTYFMPEPLIFYCAVMGQLSLIFITLGYFFANALQKIKNICIGLITHVGTPKANANSVIVLIILGLISMPVIMLSLFGLLTL